MSIAHSSSRRITPARHSGAPDRLVVCFSDVEMGAGGPYDDFPHSAWLGDILRAYTASRYDGLAIDFVFNGDTFDLLKTSHEGAWPHHVTSDIALAKMQRIADAHPAFFEALRAVLTARGRGANVHFVVGNHDPEILFPAVQDLLRARIGDRERVHFPGLSMQIGRLHIEHGSQLDPLFRLDESRPFLEHAGQTLLNLSWASVALLDVAIPLQPLLYHHDRLKPKALVLQLVPEVRELLTSAYWTYWTKDYWRDLFGAKNPVKTVSWTMLKELVRRVASFEVDVTMDDDLHERMVARDDIDVYMVGHQHEAGWWSYGLRKVLRTGALRDEYMISPRGDVQRPINKVYAEAYLCGDEIVRSQLVERVAPARPPGTMPESIFDCVPLIRERLSPPDARKQEKALQAAQEDKERGERG